MAEAHGVWGWGYLPIFLLLFWATWLTRGSFLLFGEKVRLPQSVQMWLRYAPAAALGALVAPDLFLAGGEVAFKPELVAATVAILAYDLPLKSGVVVAVLAGLAAGGAWTWWHARRQGA